MNGTGCPRFDRALGNVRTDDALLDILARPDESELERVLAGLDRLDPSRVSAARRRAVISP